MTDHGAPPAVCRSAGSAPLGRHVR